MTRRVLANVVSTLAAVAVGGLAMGGLHIEVGTHSVLLDWVVLVFSATTMGIVAFFLVWGHFQKDPLSDQ